MTSLRSHLILGYLLLVLLLAAAAWVTVFTPNRPLLLIILALCMLISGLFVIAIARGIIQPLDALTRSTLQIQSGDLEPKVDLHGASEITNLGRSFNAMAATLLGFR